VGGEDVTTIMVAMKDVVKAVQEADLDSTVIMIGGSPVAQSYADEIGVQGYTPDATSAIDKAKELLEMDF